MTKSIASSDPQERSEANSAYRGALSANVREIMTVWQQVCSEHDARALTVLHRLAHNLNGACSLMGYLELGKAARTLEQRVALLIPHQGQLSPQELGELEQLTDALRRADPVTKVARGTRGEV